MIPPQVELDWQPINIIRIKIKQIAGFKVFISIDIIWKPVVDIAEIVKNTEYIKALLLVTVFEVIDRIKMSGITMTRMTSSAWFSKFLKKVLKTYWHKSDKVLRW